MEIMAFKYYLVTRGNGGSVDVVNNPEGRHVLNTFDALDAAMVTKMAWVSVRRDILFLQKRAAFLEPAASGVFSLFLLPPDGFVAQQAPALYADAWVVFDGIVTGSPGTMREKFEAMGRSPLLAYYCGVSPHPLSDRDRARYIQQEETGWIEPDEEIGGGRSKAVFEPATGRRWSSATELAAELGCHRVTLYNHLRGAPNQSSVCGREFKYVPTITGPVPGSIDAMSPDEKQGLRDKMRAQGWEPKF